MAACESTSCELYETTTLVVMVIDCNGQNQSRSEICRSIYLNCFQLVRLWPDQSESSKEKEALAIVAKLPIEGGDPLTTGFKQNNKDRNTDRSVLNSLCHTWTLDNVTENQFRAKSRTSAFTHAANIRKLAVSNMFTHVGNSPGESGEVQQ